MTWRVRVQVGDVVIDATQLQPWEDPRAEVELPALVELGWVDQLETDTWPAATGPSSGSAVIRFAEAADVAWVTTQTAVAIDFYREADDTTPVAGLYGRAAVPEFTPHSRGVDVRFTVTDYLGDLAEHTIGASTWPAEDAYTRLDRMFSLVGLPTPLISGVGADLALLPVLAARDPDPQNMLTLLRETLSWVVWTSTAGGGTTLRMREVRPNIDLSGTVNHGLDDTQPWVLATMDRTADAHLVLALDGDGELVPADPLPDWARIDAGWVLLGSTWARRRQADVNTVSVVLADKSRVEASDRGGMRGISTRRETQLVDSDDGQLLADYLLPDRTATLPPWEVARSTVKLDRTPEGWWPGRLGEVRVIEGVQPQHNPEGTDWVAGVIMALETRIAGGVAEVDVTLGSRPVTT